MEWIIHLLTVAEAAEALALSERSTRSLIAGGSLPVVRVGTRAVRVHPDDLRRFIEEPEIPGRVLQNFSKNKASVRVLRFIFLIHTF